MSANQNSLRARIARKYFVEYCLNTPMSSSKTEKALNVFGVVGLAIMAVPVLMGIAGFFLPIPIMLAAGAVGIVAGLGMSVALFTSTARRDKAARAAIDADIDNGKLVERYTREVVSAARQSVQHQLSGLQDLKASFAAGQTKASAAPAKARPYYQALPPVATI